MTIKNIKIKKLTKREIEKKKKLARQYRGISYDAVRDEFVVRYRLGTDVNNNPIYIKPIKRYNNFESAVQCLSEYKKLAEKNVARRRIITLKKIHEIYTNLHKSLWQEIKKDKLSDKSRNLTPNYNLIGKRLGTLKLIKDQAPELYLSDLKKINDSEENLVQSYYEIVRNKDLKYIKKKTIDDYFSRLVNILGDRHNGIEQLLSINGVNIKDHKFKIKKIRTTSERDMNPDLRENLRSYSIEELNSLYKTAKEEKSGRTLLLLLLLLATGGRINELLNIGVDRIKSKFTDEDFLVENNGQVYNIKLDLENYIIIYRQRNRVTGAEAYAKTNVSNRPVVICDYLFRIIQSYIKKYNLKNNDKLFFKFKGNGKNISISDDRVGDIMTRLEKKAGVKHIKGRTNHAHRNDLITFFEDILGVKEGTVRFFVGHTGKKDAHQRYNIVNEKEVKAIRAKEFKAAQMAYLMTVINNYSSDRAVKIFKDYLNYYEEYSPKYTQMGEIFPGVEENKKLVVTKRKEVNYQEILKREKNGEDFFKIAIDMALFENETDFDKESYEQFKKLWEEQYDEFWNLPRSERKKYVSFDEYFDSYDERLRLKYGMPSYEEEGLAEANRYGELHSAYENKLKNLIKDEVNLKNYYMYNEALKNYRINNTFEDFKADVFDDEDNIIKEKYISFCKNKV